MDWGARLLTAVILAVAARVITLSFVPAVQDAALARFHLQSSSFLAWGIQAPVPAMYNFRNTWQLVDREWDRSSMSESVGGTLNHFPARVLTFGDMRRSVAQERARTRVRLESTYRGKIHISVWRFEDGPGGSMTLVDETGQ